MVMGVRLACQAVAAEDDAAQRGRRASNTKNNIEGSIVNQASGSTCRAGTPP
jgi:hypothetical protein